MKFFVAIIIILIPFKAIFAYEPTQTHAGLTEQIVEFYNLKFGSKISDTQKELIIKGAMEEDVPATRATNHFYDPVRNIGIEGGRTAKSWALEDLVANDFSWSKAIDAYARGDMNSAFIALGHNIHLVEDMGVPDHTRNDQHLPFIDEDMGGNSPYEDWAMENKNRNTLRGLGLSYVNDGVDIKLFLQLGGYFDFLANYSNKNFFSKDTILRQDVYPRPVIERSDHFYGYSKDDITGREEKLVKRIEFEDHIELKISDKDDSSVLSSYFDRLALQVIPSGAGVINLFFKEGEQARIIYEAELLKKQQAEAQANVALAQSISQKGFIGLAWSGAVLLAQDNLWSPFKGYVLKPIGSGLAFAGNFVIQEVPVAVNIGQFATVTTAGVAKDTAVAGGNFVAEKAVQGLTIIQQTVTNVLNAPVDNQGQLAGPILALSDTEPINSDTQPTETQTLSQNSVLPNTEILSAKSTASTQTQTNSGYYGGGGGSSPAPRVPVPQVDVTAPIITVLGDNPATSTVNSEYVDAGATATDDVDGVISVTSTSTVNTAIPGLYFVTYTAVDASGNTATSSRAVNIVDTTAPEITINGASPTTIEINSTYSDLGATVIDAVDGARAVVTTSNVDTSRIGTYSVTYVASDLSQNTSTSTRTVNVVDIIEILPILFSDLNTNGIADADESDVIATSTKSLTAGEYHFNNLTITNNATLTLAGDTNSSSTFKGVKIVATNITVNAGSRISADAKGDTAGTGFPSSVSAGGSHGGVGLHNIATSTYGSAKQPTTLGSAGGAPHAIGGGAIRLVVSGALVNNGIISADGNTSSSGGSIYATVANMTGSGTFHANGGALGGGGYFSGPGGGGRVAIYYQTSSFAGTTQALGGCGSYDGWTQTCAEKGTAGLFDIINNNFSTESSWRFQANDGTSNFNNITFSSGAVVTMDESVTLNANELQSNGASFTISNGSSITIPSFIVSGGTVTLSGGETLAINTLTLSGNAIITVAQERTLALSVTNLTIGAGSSISANYKGYGQSAGPGAGFSNAGASHGGVGLWNTATSTYGSTREPTEMGSGGNGYNPRGGGAIRIVVSGSLANNGSITAMGNDTSSGGSIYVTTNDLSGAGEFRADGGTVYCPNSCVGAGAGGRIAVYYQTSTFSGIALASGPSSSYGKAGDGTVVIEEIVATPPLSSARAINTFEFLIGTSTVSGIIDETAHTVSITVPFGTDISSLSPLIIVSSLATSSPASATMQDFTNPATYTVAAEDGSTQAYTVTVTIAPDTVSPTITSYTFNETAGDITVDFATTTSVSLALTASENVDWVSIKIEDQNTPESYKIFFSGVGCVDGTATCVKSWDGKLSSGEGIAPNSIYRIKAHIRDMAGNVYQDYISPYMITVNTVLP